MLYDAEDWYGCANRAYYAAYQAATSICILHGDSSQFLSGWNNPTHDQLPDLIKNNGSLTIATRQQVAAQLRFLRGTRENADYRAMLTLSANAALQCILGALIIFRRLDIEERVLEEQK